MRFSFSRLMKDTPSRCFDARTCLEFRRRAAGDGKQIGADEFF
jgi:hypothetical protein